jgi:hypothetical protein
VSLALFNKSIFVLGLFSLATSTKPFRYPGVDGEMGGSKFNTERML